MAMFGNLAAKRPSRNEVDPTIDIQGLVDLLWRRKLLILGTAVLVTALALVVLTLIGSRYAATARLLIDPRELRVVENELVQRGLGNDLILVESQVEVITSETVLKRVVEKEKLASDIEFYKPSTTGQTSARTPDEIALESLAKATKVARAENTYVIEITVTTKEAVKSARLANAIAAAYTDDQRDATASATRNVSTSIEDRLSELQAGVRDAEQKVQSYKTANNVTSVEGRPLVDTRMNELSQRLAAAVSATAETKSKLDTIEGAMRQRGDVASVVSDTENSTMVQLRGQLADAQRRLAELQQVMGPRHPRVARALGEVAQVQESIRSESQRLVAATRDAYRNAQETEAGIAASLRNLTQQSFASNEKLIELRELERQAQAARLVYESFLVRARETSEQQNLGARTARIIAPAAVPDKPAFPPKSILMLAAAVFGLGLGVFNAIAADFLAQRKLLARRPRAGAAAVAETADDALLATAAPADGSLAAARFVMVLSSSRPDVAQRAARECAAAAVAEGFSTLEIDLGRGARRPGLSELSTGRARASDVVLRRADGADWIGAGDERAGVSAEGLRRAFGFFAEAYDRIYVNVGAFQGDAGELAALAVEFADHAVLAVPGEMMDEGENATFSALSGSGRAVTVIAVDMRLPVAA